MRRGSRRFLQYLQINCLYSKSDPQCLQAVSAPAPGYRSNASNESAAETSRYESVSVAWFEDEVAEITLIDEFMRLCALHNSFGPSRYNR